MQMRDEMTTAAYAARAGGAIIRSLFGQDLAAREKRGADLVTEADEAAEATRPRISEAVCDTKSHR